MPLAKGVVEGTVFVQQIDPAELAPGGARLRSAPRGRGARRRGRGDRQPEWISQRHAGGAVSHPHPPPPRAARLPRGARDSDDPGHGAARPHRHRDDLLGRRELPGRLRDLAPLLRGARPDPQGDLGAQEAGRIPREVHSRLRHERGGDRRRTAAHPVPRPAHGRRCRMAITPRRSARAGPRRRSARSLAGDGGKDRAAAPAGRPRSRGRAGDCLSGQPVEEPGRRPPLLASGAPRARGRGSDAPRAGRGQSAHQRGEIHAARRPRRHRRRGGLRRGAPPRRRHRRGHRRLADRQHLWPVHAGRERHWPRPGRDGHRPLTRPQPGRAPPGRGDGDQRRYRPGGARSR